VIWHPCLNLHPDHHTLVFNPQKPTRFYLGEDGGFYRFRTDQPYTHVDLNPEYSTIQYYAGCYFPTGISAYGGSQDNGTHYIKDAGETAFSIFGGDGAYCAVNQQYANISYVSYQNGTIHRADDADLNAPSFYYIADEMDADGDGDIDDGAWFINPFEINLFNGDYLGFVTLKRYWQTTDGGYSWQPATTGGSNAPYAIGISRSFNPTVYVGGTLALLQRIDNAFDAVPGNEVNLTTKVPTSITNDFIANITVHPFDSSICYFALSNFSDQPRVWKITDGTSANPVFTSISGDLPANLPVNYIDVDPLSPDSFFLAGTDFGLYISEDAGNHWQHIDGIPNTFVEQVKVRAADRRVFIFTHGRGMWTATLDQYNVGISNVVQSGFPVTIFPNPVSEQLYIRSTSNSVTVTVRDVNDRIIIPATIVSANEPLDFSSVPGGIYFAELKNGQQVTVKKVVKAD
jgi:hypothetical protein